MKSIIEREVTFKNNTDIEVKVAQKNSSRSFAKDTHRSKICSTITYIQPTLPMGKGLLLIKAALCGIASLLILKSSVHVNQLISRLTHLSQTLRH